MLAAVVHPFTGDVWGVADYFAHASAFATSATFSAACNNTFSG